MEKEKKTRIQISANVDGELWKLAKQYNLGWTEALEFGIAFKLAEKDANYEMPKNILTEKIEKLAKKIQDQAEQIEKLKPKQEPEEVISVEAEADEVLGALPKQDETTQGKRE